MKGIESKFSWGVPFSELLLWRVAWPTESHVSVLTMGPKWKSLLLERLAREWRCRCCGWDYLLPGAAAWFPALPAKSRLAQAGADAPGSSESHSGQQSPCPDQTPWDSPHGLWVCIVWKAPALAAAASCVRVVNHRRAWWRPDTNFSCTSEQLYLQSQLCCCHEQVRWESYQTNTQQRGYVSLVSYLYWSGNLWFQESENQL